MRLRIASARVLIQTALLAVALCTASAAMAQPRPQMRRTPQPHRASLTKNVAAQQRLVHARPQQKLPQTKANLAARLLKSLKKVPAKVPTKKLEVATVAGICAGGTLAGLGLMGVSGDIGYNYGDFAGAATFATGIAVGWPFVSTAVQLTADAFRGKTAEKAAPGKAADAAARPRRD